MLIIAGSSQLSNSLSKQYYGFGQTYVQPTPSPTYGVQSPLGQEQYGFMSASWEGQGQFPM
jgi:hypothetical protein